MKFSERLSESWNKQGFTVEKRLIEALRELDVLENQKECFRKFSG